MNRTIASRVGDCRDVMSMLDNDATLILEWLGPYSPHNFCSPTEDLRLVPRSGVYLWVEKRVDHSVLSYIGKAEGKTTLAKRQCEHYLNIIGGRSTIPGEFMESGTDWVPNLALKQVAYDYLEEDRFLKIIAAGFRYASACQIYFASITEISIIKRAERQLLYDLQPVGTRQGTKSPPKTPLTIRHKNTTWINDEMEKRFCVALETTT